MSSFFVGDNNIQLLIQVSVKTEDFIKNNFKELKTIPHLFEQTVPTLMKIFKGCTELHKEGTTMLVSYIDISKANRGYFIGRFNKNETVKEGNQTTISFNENSEVVVTIAKAVMTFTPATIIS